MNQRNRIELKWEVYVGVEFPNRDGIILMVTIE